MTRIGISLIVSAALAVCGSALAQTPTAPPVGSATATPDNAVLLTVFLKHDESRPLNELNAQLAKQGFYKAFPPPGIEVVSWYVAMRVGEVNRVIEDTAWGVYRTEFFLSYDYKAVGLENNRKAQ